MSEFAFTVVFAKDKDGRIIASCPALQGCFTDGETIEEASANISEAIRASIESRLKDGETIYPEIATEKIRVVI